VPLQPGDRIERYIVDAQPAGDPSTPGDARPVVQDPIKDPGAHAGAAGVTCTR